MKPFAAFDIDGTLIRWQLYHAAVNELAKEGHLGDGAYERIRTARMTWKRREDPDAFRAYEHEVIDVFDTAVERLDHQEFLRIGAKIIDIYKDQAYVYTRDLMKRLQHDGYFLLAISGSHHELVGMLAEHYGFDDWIGSKYHREGDRYVGTMDIASADKGRLLGEFVSKHNLTFENSYAVGDSLSDSAMLEMVEHPIAFNPDRRLFERAKAESWPIVVERKNMIYELEPDNGEYKLSDNG